MNATTTKEREVLDLAPIEREAQPIAVQQTGNKEDKHQDTREGPLGVKNDAEGNKTQ